MLISTIIILLATGATLGFISGLLGIGGGILMTPVQYWLYTSSGINPDTAIKIAFATSLAVILPTAASGMYQHHRKEAINWKIAIFMGIFTAIGGAIGASLAVHLPGTALKIAFGSIGILIGIRMLVVKIPDSERPIRDNPWLWISLALPIGIITGILGMGGGVLVVPVLALVLGFSMHRAIATSLAIMLFTSTGGIIGYIINGFFAENLPEFTLGYVYWPAWIALTAGSIGTATLGALFAHKIPGKILYYIFIALIFYVSLDMTGLFAWLKSLVL